MTIKDFDYKSFAENLAGQAGELVPQDFAQHQKDYVKNTLLNFSMLAGEALYQDKDNLGFTADQASMITQIIAEWAFHKSVDLIRSGIPQQFWDQIMQKIAFTIFEIAKQTFKQNMPQDQILQLVEHHVKKTWLDSIAELKKKNYIDEALMEKAAAQSNIDAVMQQMQEEQQELPPQPPQQGQVQMPVPQGSGKNAPTAQVPQGAMMPDIQDPTRPPVVQSHRDLPQLLKLVSVALVLKRIDDEEQVQVILDRFEPEDAGRVIRYMSVDGLEDKVDPNVITKYLEEMEDELPKATEINKKKVVQRVKHVVDVVGKSTMEHRIQLERNKVRQFVFNAVDGEYFDISTKIADVIATYLETGV